MREPTLWVVMGLESPYRTKLARSYGQANAALVVSKSVVEQAFPNLSTARAATVLSKKIDRPLKHGGDVVFEDGCLTTKRRKGLITHLENARIKCQKVCVLVLSDCDLAQRGEELEKFQCPWYSEGWDRITIVREDRIRANAFEESQSLLERMATFNQMNSHHTLTLGAHCDKACDLAKEKNFDRFDSLAARWHDVGKLWTQSIENGEGHYRAHANFSAYAWLRSFSALTCENPDDALRVAVVIGLHMRPYEQGWREALAKAGYDSKIIEAVARLHEFDKGAH